MKNCSYKMPERKCKKRMRSKLYPSEVREFCSSNFVDRDYKGGKYQALFYFLAADGKKKTKLEMPRH